MAKILRAPMNFQNNNRLILIWFIISTVLLFLFISFFSGFISAKRHLFPHDAILDLVDSAIAVKDLFLLEIASDLSGHEIIAPMITKGGVTVNNLATDSTNDYIFMTLYKDGEFLAQVIDRDGNVLHTWHIPYEELKFLVSKITGVPLSKNNLTIHGALPYENGEILLVVTYRGLVKLDQNSKLLWAVELPIHHAVTHHDGYIWALSSKMIKNKDNWIPLATAPHMSDVVLQLSPDGEIIEEFSILDIIKKNRYEGILYGGPPGEPKVYRDPLHVNDIDILTKTQANLFPNAKEGDVMISMRTISTILIFNPRTQLIIWSMTGPFHRQHDPMISDNEALLVFDNRTAQGQLGGGAKYITEPQELGYSRILLIDPISRIIVWEYQGTRENPFYTSIQGKLDELPNGNILVVEAEGGRIFEIDKKSKIIVWEFVNMVEEGIVGRVTQANWFSKNQLSFLPKAEME
jgi:hypothetical protein